MVHAQRLLLLTSSFPFPGGDSSFVQHEIDALASVFDEVAIVAVHPSSAERLAMPANAKLVGTVETIRAREGVRALLNPRRLGRFVRVTAAELASGSITGHFRRFLYFALYGLAAARRLEKTLRELPPANTTIYSFWAMELGLAIPWMTSANRAAAVRVHRWDLYEEERGYLPYRRSLFKNVDRIFTISEHAGRYLESKYASTGIGQKISLRRLGTRDHGEGKRAGPASVPLIVSCSACIPVKRVDRIADALEQLGRKSRWIHFGDGPTRGEIEGRIPSLRARGVEAEFRGSTPNRELMSFYQATAVTVFVNTSESEGVPVSIMEAMSFGIPVVATDVGGTSEIVGRDLGSGELVDAGASAEEIARTILAVIDDRHAYAPRATWERRSSAATNSRAVAEELRELHDVHHA